MNRLFLLILCLLLSSTASFGVINTSVASTTTFSSALGQKQTLKQRLIQKTASVTIRKQAQNAVPDDDNSKLMAIICYISLLGFIIAAVMNSNEKSAFVSYHLAQSLGNFLFSLLSLAFFLVLFFVPFVGIFGLILYYILGLLTLVNTIFGIINAVNEKEKPVPIFGKLFERLIVAFD